MTAISQAAVDAFNAAQNQVWKESAPISQGDLVTVNRAATVAGLEAALPLLLAAELDRIRAVLVPALLAAVRCIPDGEIRSGCVVHDGATVRKRLKDAYREALGPGPTTEGDPR